MRINEDDSKYNVGPFHSVEEAISYLEGSNDNINENEKRKRN
jgi:hypothetical protein